MKASSFLKRLWLWLHEAYSPDDCKSCERCEPVRKCEHEFQETSLAELASAVCIKALDWCAEEPQVSLYQELMTAFATVERMTLERAETACCPHCRCACADCGVCGDSTS
jgi:hypothetical protein